MTKDQAWLIKEKYGGKVLSERKAEYEADLRRLALGEPLAYVLTYLPFLGVKIYLTARGSKKRPLIPRPETEYWVDKAIKELEVSLLPEPSVLDLCAGSGAIALAVSKALPKAKLTLVEIDPSLYSIILRNIRNNKLPTKQIEIVIGSLFTSLPKARRFDFILTNPPYLDWEASPISPTVRKFEPRRALDGGPGGLSLIEKIIKALPLRLTSAGVCYLEHEPEQTKAINELARLQKLNITNHQDQYKTVRYSRLSVAK